MSDTKVFTFGEQASAANNSIAAMLPALLQNRSGIDLAAVMGMMNGGRNGGGFFGNNGGFQDIIALIVIAAIFGNGNGGGIFGGGNNNNGTREGQEMIMQTLNRNGVDIAALASALGTSTDKIYAAVNSVSQAICGLGTQIGQGFNQVLTSMLQGNNALTQQIASCCCDIKTVIATLNTGMERGFSSIGYELRDQTCSLQKSVDAAADRIIAGQRAAEMREMQREITERDRTIAKQDVIINNAQQTGVFSQMITQAIAPIGAALQGLKSDVDGIKCKLPETTNIPYSPVVGVPTCVAAQYGLGFGLGTGFGLGNGFWG